MRADQHNFIAVIRLAALLAVGCGACALTGCRKQATERKYHAVSGVAESIDVNTGRVAMRWRKRPDDDGMEFFGHITQETEIFINGISAGVEEVRIGDPVEVTVYLDGDTWIVTRVAVTRRDDYMLEKALTSDPPTDHSEYIGHPLTTTRQPCPQTGLPRRPARDDRHVPPQLRD